MSDFAIRAAGLGKRYRLGATLRHDTLRDRITHGIAASLRRKQRDEGMRGGVASGVEALRERDGSGRSGPKTGDFWALREVDFEVAHGEVLGLIGRNGAGKSTLLKILGQITEPTEGEVRIRGRVASLLEVGTGFHPELTGRENIFLNGAILGMTRAEIRRNFDAIVAFADVERFLDTPVKRYSSGMYVRLAFAVAAHLEPEVLLVDEVLAVGDSRFQRRCLEKMDEVSSQGRTVLFVSHNMAAVSRLCPRVILLDGGKVAKDGLAHEVVRHYLSEGLGSTAHREWAVREEAPGNDVVRLRHVHVRTGDGGDGEVVDIRSAVRIEFQYDVLKPGFCLRPVCRLIDDAGTILFTSLDTESKWREESRPAGTYRSEMTVPGNFFSEGTITVMITINTFSPRIVHVAERDVAAFQVVEKLDVAGESARVDFTGEIGGVVRPLLEWRTRGPE